MAKNESNNSTPVGCPDEPRNHSGIIMAIVFATAAIVGAGFLISSQFEKPRQFASVTFDPATQELVYSDEIREMAKTIGETQEAYFKVLSERDALQAKLDGKKPIPPPAVVAHEIDQLIQQTPTPCCVTWHT